MSLFRLCNVANFLAKLDMREQSGLTHSERHEADTKKPKKNLPPGGQRFRNLPSSRAVSTRKNLFCVFISYKKSISHVKSQPSTLSIHFIRDIRSVLFTTRTGQMYKQPTQLWMIVRCMHRVRSLCTGSRSSTGLEEWKCETLPCSSGYSTTINSQDKNQLLQAATINPQHTAAFSKPHVYQNAYRGPKYNCTF